MDFSEYLIAFIHRSHDDTDGGQIVYLFQRFIFGFHFFINRIKVFGSPENFTLDSRFFQNSIDFFHHEINERVALFQLLMNVFHQKFKRGRVDIF